MRSKKWREIVAAKELLRLGDEASLDEIKRAYRRMSKKHHPDLRRGKKGEVGDPAMQELNAAYKILYDYCVNFRISLVLNDESKPLDDEDWWLSRFGEDPLWGKKI